MIKKEIGCKTTQYETFPFIACSNCYLVQGDMDCIDFRKSTGAKMVYGTMNLQTLLRIQAERSG